MNWKIRVDVYTLPWVKQTASWKLLYSSGGSAWCSVMTWRSGMGVRELQEGGDMCIPTADSLNCTAETDIPL